MSEPIPIFHGEAQLIRWGDGPQGHTVTLRLSSDPKAINPFKGLPLGDNGQRMEIACVLKDDHEEPIDPGKAKANSRRRKAPAKSDNGPAYNAAAASGTETLHAGAQAQDKPRTYRSNTAAMRVKDRAFQEWFWGMLDKTQHELRWLKDSISTDEGLQTYLGISSKRELDVPGPKAEAFDKLITTFDNRQYLR